MCRNTKFANLRPAIVACISALISLATFLLPMQNALAQPGCTPSVGDAPTFLEVRAHVGDTVHIPRVDLVVGNNTCQLANGTNWLIYPDNTVALITAGYTTTYGVGETISCPGSVGRGCVGYTDTYVIKAGDVNRTLTFTRPRSGEPASSAGTANTISILAATEADAILELPGTFGTGSGNKRITILNPCIGITKVCDYPPTPCGGTNFPYGSPISFSGIVTNCSPSPDTRLVNVAVTDTPSGPVSSQSAISYGNVISNGVAVRAFDGTLFNNEKVSYSGFYVPSGNLCGPFSDTVVACGTDTATTPLQKTVCATNSATCLVCTSPCIDVTKNCAPSPVKPGDPQTISGIVTNCGNVPLTNVVVTDNILGAITNIALLPVNTAVAYSKTFTAGCVGNTNTVTATATGICGGPVTKTATAPCLVTKVLCMTVTKDCAPSPVKPGDPQTISGCVSNCSNMGLTNIVITDNVLGAVTNISIPAPGLLQGQSICYSKTFTAGCVGNTNTVTAIGKTICGDSITNTATAPCLVTKVLCMTVTKDCAPSPVKPGDPQTISGVVSNCSNMGLTNIVITDNVLGAVTNISIPAPGLPQGGTIAYSKTFTAGCVGNTNTVTAIGKTICGDSITNTATAPCLVTFNPCIAVTKVCTPSGCGPNDAVPPGTVITFSGYVTNCGDVTLSNVVVIDTLLISPPNVYTFPTVPLLSVGGAVPYSINYTSTVADVSKCITNVIVASATVCGNLVGPVTNKCSFSVGCYIDGKVEKEVVCWLPNGCDTNWSSIATGAYYEGGGLYPSFCYRFRVCNTSNCVLYVTNIVDSEFGDISGLFGGVPFTVDPFSCTAWVYTNNVERTENTTNTVTLRGVDATATQYVERQDTAIALVVPIDIYCEALVSAEGSAESGLVQIPCDGQSHVITNTVRICNVGSLPLANIHVYAPDLVSLGCTDITNTFSLDVGECVTNICIDAVTCPPECGYAFTNHVKVTGEVDLSKTNVCIYTQVGTNVVAQHECEARVSCVQPRACRVTGGGRQDVPEAWPPVAGLRYVTHGGQVGAPVGIQVCEVTRDFFLGNPCIHGNWQHVRHLKGGLKGNFHAKFYDTLKCACLDTNLVNGFYGDGTVTNGCCNPGNRVLGPEPRKAPANKIAFTGTGDWADPNGRRTPRTTLFRVDIEDRGEPGGSHPKGGTPPADRYRIRIWVLSAAELIQLNSASGTDPYLLNFRNKISACNGLIAPDGAVDGSGARVSTANGTQVFGVRTPDIDDGGELERGNHQIHPSIQDCDPYNPTGPGLPHLK